MVGWEWWAARLATTLAAPTPRNFTKGLPMTEDIQIPVDTVPLVGITADGLFIGVVAVVRNPAQPRVTFALPVEIMPHLIARLIAQTATGAQRAAQRAGETAAAVREAMEALPLHVSAAGLASRTPDRAHVIVHLQIGEGDGNAILPLALPRDVASALASELARVVVS